MQTIQLPLSGYVAGDTFPSWTIIMEDQAGKVVAAARIHFRQTLQSFPALEFDSAKGSIDLQPVSEGKQVLVMAQVLTPRLQAGTYTGDLEVTFTDNTVKTLFRCVFSVLPDYTP